MWRRPIPSEGVWGNTPAGKLNFSCWWEDLIRSCPGKGKLRFTQNVREESPLCSQLSLSPSLCISILAFLGLRIIGPLPCVLMLLYFPTKPGGKPGFWKTSMSLSLLHKTLPEAALKIAETSEVDTRIGKWHEPRCVTWPTGPAQSFDTLNAPFCLPIHSSHRTPALMLYQLLCKELGLWWWIG